MNDIEDDRMSFGNLVDVTNHNSVVDVHAQDAFKAWIVIDLPQNGACDHLASPLAQIPLL